MSKIMIPGKKPGLAPPTLPSIKPALPRAVPIIKPRVTVAAARGPSLDDYPVGRKKNPGMKVPSYAKA